MAPPLAIVLALLLSADASAGEPPAPEHSVTVSDDKGEYAYRPWWNLGEDSQWHIRPVLKAGALALTESFPYPYPILKRSPFALGGMKVVYSGSLEAAAIVTGGVVNLRSQRLLEDPAGALGSSANKNSDRDVSQTELMSSAYLDVGKTFDAGAGWKGAFFAAADQFSLKPLGGAGKYGGDMMVEANVGTAWLKRSGAHELSLFGDVAFEAAQKKLYRNELDFELVPSAKAGAEYALNVGPSRYLAGVEAGKSRADSMLRPYIGVERDRLGAILAAEFREGDGRFYPDSKAVAARVNAQLSDSLKLGVSARHETSRYAMAPSAENDTRVMAELSWSPSSKLVVQSAKTWAARREVEYEQRKQEELQTKASDAATQAQVRAMIAASPTLPDFYKAYQPKSSLGVLAAVAEMTRLFNQYNYNNNEGSPPNLQSVDEIYSRARQSYLNSSSDPTLVCLGAAQFAAAAAEELGRRNGVPIQATGVSMEVSDANGKQSGHAVAAVKTQEYGIVFVDWGRVTPTYTWDTEKALRLYQALGGQPAMFHQITDPSRDGRHVGYLFTEEGKLLVNNLTFHDEARKPPVGKLFQDEPRGDQVTVERYKELLRRKP